MTYPRCLILIAAVCLTSSSTQAVLIETVPIGNAGNSPDTTVAYYLNTCCNGAVPYTYRIGRYEVTNSQYAEFLNAVAKTDTHELYHPRMGESFRGGIVRTGVNGNYHYSVRPAMVNKPVIMISFWDAARYANWLHNGQPSGGQDTTTTENGAYALGGETFPPNTTVDRLPGAKWFLPSEDEWYKAAFYDPRDAASGGPAGDDHYWTYATMSDEDPIAALASSSGDVINAGPNVANYDLSAKWNSIGGNVTTVGGAGPQSASYYETYDQVGNVWEWNDTRLEHPRLDATYRINRGGNWDDVVHKLRSEYRGYGGIQQCGTVFQCFNESQGFRVARLFSPLDLNGDDRADAKDIGLLSQQVNVATLNTAYDLNDDGRVDDQDRIVWVEELMNTSFGDSDLDGRFNSSDLVRVLSYGEYEDGLAMNSSWTSGDWNGDFEFNSNDIVLALQRGRYEQSPSSSAQLVPEPATLGLVTILSSLAFPLVRRRMARRPNTYR